MRSDSLPAKQGASLSRSGILNYDYRTHSAYQEGEDARTWRGTRVIVNGSSRRVRVSVRVREKEARFTIYCSHYPFLNGKKSSRKCTDVQAGTHYTLTAIQERRRERAK